MHQRQCRCSRTQLQCVTTRNPFCCLHQYVPLVVWPLMVRTVSADCPRVRNGAGAQPIIVPTSTKCDRQRRTLGYAGQPLWAIGAAMTARPPIRIALNVALDGMLAAVAVPLARAIANPAGDALHPLWLLPIGGVTLLLAGLPFRLPWQYWRFAGMGDLLSVVCASVLGAGIFAALADALGVPFANPALPIVHALTLLVLLGAPRVAYRRLRERRGGTVASGFAPDVPAALIVGATEDIDLFLRALTWDRRQTLRVEGLLAVGARQTGRRIQNYPFLGAIDNAAAVLEKLDAEGRLPDTLVVATPD